MNPVDPWVTVVGVVGNIRRFARDDEIRSEMYRPFTQHGDRRRGDRRPGQAETRAFVTDVAFVVRTTAAPEDVRRSAQATLTAIDPAMPLGQVSTLQEDLERAVAPRRFLLRLFFAFAAAALVLAALGVYGVTAYLARRRTREMAVRVALGASPQSIEALVVRQGIFIAIYGIAGGLVLARLFSHFLQQVPLRGAGVRRVDLHRDRGAARRGGAPGVIRAGPAGRAPGPAAGAEARMTMRHHAGTSTRFCRYP